jgi:hypothetical protein
MPPRRPFMLWPSAVARQRLRALRWWRGLSPSRQDRFVTMAPLVSVLLFLAAIISAVWNVKRNQ